MSHDLQADHTTATASAGSADHLRRLYVARFAFALVWAGLFAVTASELGPISVTLLLLYPLYDVAAAAHDLRSPGGSRSSAPLRLTIALSAVTAVALAAAASSGIPDVLRVWGAWAIAAGVVQLVLALRRRGLRGQRAIVLSGAISVVAGVGFVLSAGGSDPSLVGLAGYATLGGIFFLVSALRLRAAS